MPNSILTKRKFSSNVSEKAHNVTLVARKNLTKCALSVFVTKINDHTRNCYCFVSCLLFYWGDVVVCRKKILMTKYSEVCLKLSFIIRWWETTGVFGLRERNREERKTRILMNEFGLKLIQIYSLKSVFFSLPNFFRLCLDWWNEIEYNGKEWDKLMVNCLDYKNNNRMKYDGMNFVSYYHFILNCVPSNLGGKRCNVNFLSLHHKLSKQWNDIFISFRSTLFHFILFRFISFHYIPLIQTKP
jgi:hypothetical protein